MAFLFASTRAAARGVLVLRLSAHNARHVAAYSSAMFQSMRGRDLLRLRQLEEVANARPHDPAAQLPYLTALVQ
jgi:hypothetical protein